MATLRTTQSPRTCTHGGFSWSPRLCHQHQFRTLSFSQTETPSHLAITPAPLAPGTRQLALRPCGFARHGRVPECSQQAAMWPCVTGASPRVMSRFVAAQRGLAGHSLQDKSNNGRSPLFLLWRDTCHGVALCAGREGGLHSGCCG